MPHGDYTGNQKAALAAQFHKEQQLKANHMTMISDIAVQEAKETIDLIPGGYASFEEYQNAKRADQENYDKRLRELYPGRWEEKPSGEGEIEVGEVSNAMDDENYPITFRCSDTVEGVTLGNGTENIFDLEAGREYRVPYWAYKHLDSVDLVWH